MIANEQMAEIYLAHAPAVQQDEDRQAPVFIAVPHGIEAMVCAEIAARQSKGIAKYGTTVADNPLSLREWLQHQYEELLDAAVYCRRAIAEIDAQDVPYIGPDRRACGNDLDDMLKAGFGGTE